MRGCNDDDSDKDDDDNDDDNDNDNAPPLRLVACYLLLELHVLLNGAPVHLSLQPWSL